MNGAFAKAWLVAWAGLIGVSLLISPAAASVPGARAWDAMTAQRLLAYVEAIGSHGLDPALYETGALRAALHSEASAELDTAADTIFAAVAHDLADGHVPAAERVLATFDKPPLSDDEIALLRARALAAGDVAGALESLAPQARDYSELRGALNGLPPTSVAERGKIVASLERLRWLPHEPGSTYLLVDIPQYQAWLSRGGVEIASHQVIVGKPSTPSRQFAAAVTGVVVNPPWYVPQSIVAESIGRLIRVSPARARARGFSWTRQNGRLSVVQSPGPQNALGLVRLDMPNPFNIYLHDTPDKTLFNKSERHFSHGCIRAERPLELAAELLGNESARAMIDAAVAKGTTQRIAIASVIPVYVVYLTARPDASGRVVYFNDIYNLDRELNADLLARRR